LIREALAEDIEQIINIEKESFTRPWSKDSFLNEFEKNFSMFYVYVLDETVVGYAIIWHIGEMAEIANIAISKSYRGKGLGEDILRFVINKLPFIKEIFLEVEDGNNPAISLYQKFGFKEIRVIDNYYGMGRNALVMVLKMGDSRRGELC